MRSRGGRGSTHDLGPVLVSPKVVGRRAARVGHCRLSCGRRGEMTVLSRSRRR